MNFLVRVLKDISGRRGEETHLPYKLSSEQEMAIRTSKQHLLLLQGVLQAMGLTLTHTKPREAGGSAGEEEDGSWVIFQRTFPSWVYDKFADTIAMASSASS